MPTGRGHITRLGIYRLAQPAQVVAAHSMQGWLQRLRLDTEGSPEDDVPLCKTAHTNALESNMGASAQCSGECQWRPY